VEWLKVQALSSNPSMVKKQNQKNLNQPIKQTKTTATAGVAWVWEAVGRLCKPFAVC
jgi:hypothetical protein